MPSPTPTGPVAVAVDAVRTLISNLPTFQTALGVALAADALPFIFQGDIGWKIVQFSIASGVCTVMTDNPHTIQVGNTITLTGASIGTESGINLAGAHAVTAVTSDTFTFTTALGDCDTQYPEYAQVLPSRRPFAVVIEASGQAVKTQSVGTGGANVKNGAVDILFEADTTLAYANNPNDAGIEARNLAGSIVQDLSNYSGTADLIVLNDVELASLDFIDPSTQDTAVVRYERYRFAIRCTWGLEG